MGLRLRQLVIAALITTLGCVYSPAGPALLWMDVEGPMASATGTGTGKSGRSCAHNLFGLVSFGDASIELAKREAGISTVTTIDHHSTNVVGFQRFCTVLYGE
jgi:hypothetical protein